MNKYQEAIAGLKFTMEMFTFDPSNGETKTPDSLNEMDKITYDCVKFAHDYLEKYRWHDLRKDPNDLPNESLGCLVCMEKNGYSPYWFASYNKEYFELSKKRIFE